jgi:hypothetical protein
VTSWIEPIRYDPNLYIKDPELATRARALPLEAQWVLAERLAGNLKTHVLYAVPRARSQGRVARFEGPRAVPLLLELPRAALLQAVARDGALKGSLDGLPVSLALPPRAAAILAEIDGRRDFGAIHARLRQKEPGLDWLAFAAEATQVVTALGGLNRLLLRLPPAG